MATGDASRAVLTLAGGPPIYFRMAVNLARSFLRWHGGSDLRLRIVTDQPRTLPPDVAAGPVDLHTLSPELVGPGFAAKLSLDRLAPAALTLFLDADCLCVGSLEPVFERLRGHAFTVPGTLLSEGEFFGDVGQVRRRFGVSAIPNFVGALYYFEAGEVSRSIFETARSLARDYDEIGLRRLRGMPNEEPLLAIAMALHGQMPVEDDGTIKADAMFFEQPADVDVLAGRAVLRRRVGAPTRVPEVARPRVVHFNAEFSEGLAYRREAARLELVSARRWPEALATPFTYLVHTVPARLAETIRDLLRPLYRSVLGTRAIKPSARG